MFQGFIIYGSLLLSTILLGILLSSGEVTDPENAKQEQVVVSSSETKRAYVVSHESNVPKPILEVPALKAELKTNSSSDVTMRSIDVRPAVIEANQVITDEMLNQEANYTPLAADSVILSDDFDVIPSEMIQVEDNYANAVTLKNGESNDDLLLPQQELVSPDIPNDLTVQSGVISYEQIESERAYAEMKSSGNVQPSFDDPL